MSELTGKSIALPLVAKLAALKHHAAHTIKWHRHDGLEIHYVLTGALTYEFAGCRSPFTIPGGNFFIIPANKKHRAVNDAGAPSVRLGVQFNTAPSAIHTTFTPEELRQTFATIKKHALYTFRFRKRIENVAREIFKLVSGAQTVDAPRLRALICSLLLETAEELSMPERIENPNRIVPELMAYIRTHCGESLSATDLVKVSGYGRTRLFALFTAEAGITPIDFLNRCRIEKAQKLLDKGGSTVKDIAKRCGFSSSAYFISVFKKYTGNKPKSSHSIHAAT